MRYKSAVETIKKRLGMHRREQALPIGIFPGDETFTVRYGFWGFQGNNRPRQTREETYSLDRLAEVVKRVRENEGFVPGPYQIISLSDEPRILEAVKEIDGVGQIEGVS